MFNITIGIIQRLGLFNKHSNTHARYIMVIDSERPKEQTKCTSLFRRRDCISARTKTAQHHGSLSLFGDLEQLEERVSFTKGTGKTAKRRVNNIFRNSSGVMGHRCERIGPVGSTAVSASLFLFFSIFFIYFLCSVRRRRDPRSRQWWPVGRLQDMTGDRLVVGHEPVTGDSCATTRHLQTNASNGIFTTEISSI